MLGQDWQSIIAPLVVVLTVAAFVWRALRRKRPGCGSDCGCSLPNIETKKR